MQRDTNGDEYAACDTSYIESSLVGETFSVTYQACDGHMFVDMWRSSGENHWSQHFTDRAAALREYNKWAKVPEEVTSA